MVCAANACPFMPPGRFGQFEVDHSIWPKLQERLARMAARPTVQVTLEAEELAR